MERGLESGHCFYFAADKIAAAGAALKRRENNVSIYPNPDLATEIDLSPSLVDRPAIYAALGAPEAWRFNGDRLRIERLPKAGAHASAERSAWLHVAASEILPWITADGAQDRAAWARRLRAWAKRRDG